MSGSRNPLKVPASIPRGGDAQELLRFWVANNTDHVSLKVGLAGSPDKEPAMWGFILADIAKQVTKAIREENPDGPAAQEIMEQMIGGLYERLKHSPHLSGSVTKVDN